MLQVFNYKFKHDIFSHAAIIKTNHIFFWITSINRSNCHIFSLQWETTQTITMTMPYHNTTPKFVWSYKNPFMATKFAKFFIVVYKSIYGYKISTCRKNIHKIKNYNIDKY